MVLLAPSEAPRLISVVEYSLLRLISDRPEYAARRDEVEARLQRLN